MRLAGKVAIVTGAARGIGRAVAELFALEGAKVVIADIDPAGAATARAIGESAVFVEADVGDGAQATAVVEAAVARLGGLDVLVNNAAIVHKAPFLELEEADLDRVLRVNLKGAFLVGQAAARAMVAAGTKGAIVNMSSVNAVLAIPDQVPYVVSKGGLNQLTRVMALALAPHGIRVNAIGPGSILTEMLERVMADEAARRTVLSRTPLGRCGEPVEIARLALFLASDEASYVTGQCVYADGGRLGLNYTVPA
jgi:glucose 1-dehydrogenase